MSAWIRTDEKGEVDIVSALAESLSRYKTALKSAKRYADAVRFVREKANLPDDIKRAYANTLDTQIFELHEQSVAVANIMFELRYQLLEPPEYASGNERSISRFLAVASTPTKDVAAAPSATNVDPTATNVDPTAKSVDPATSTRADAKPDVGPAGRTTTTGDGAETVVVNADVSVPPPRVYVSRRNVSQLPPRTFLDRPAPVVVRVRIRGVYTEAILDKWVEQCLCGGKPNHPRWAPLYTPGTFHGVRQQTTINAPWSRPDAYYCRDRVSIGIELVPGCVLDVQFNVAPPIPYLILGRDFFDKHVVSFSRATRTVEFKVDRENADEPVQAFGFAPWVDRQHYFRGEEP